MTEHGAAAGARRADERIKVQAMGNAPHFFAVIQKKTLNSVQASSRSVLCFVDSALSVSPLAAARGRVTASRHSASYYPRIPSGRRCASRGGRCTPGSAASARLLPLPLPHSAQELPPQARELPRQHRLGRIQDTRPSNLRQGEKGIRTLPLPKGIRT